ncbi:hypothetical protein JL720_3073 [Aureococcus anophagefferens]|nr:hypothetical protein JL720_3073 [Aureococcus anophagefferens]
MILDSVTLDLYRAAMNSDAFGRGREASKVLAMDKASLPDELDFMRDLLEDAVDEARATALLDGGVRESIAALRALLTLSINDDADRAVEVYNFARTRRAVRHRESRAQHVALDKKLTFFATVLPETTSAAASFTLKMAFNSTAPRRAAGFASRPAAYAFDAAAVPNSIKLILGAVQGPRACELTYRGVQPSPSRRTPSPTSDSLKDDDETQLDSARISPPKKKRRRGPEDHPSFLSSGIPVCSQDSVVSSRSYGDDAYLF